MENPRRDSILSVLFPKNFRLNFPKTPKNESNGCRFDGETKNFLRYAVDFFEMGANKTMVQVSQTVELRRRSAMEFHLLAPLAGESLISSEMTKRIEEMIKFFVQRLDKDWKKIKIYKKIWRSIMKKTIYLIGIITLLFATNVFAQLTLPRASTRSEVSQTVGDTEIAIVYNRPNIKESHGLGRYLVPYGEVWRTGANEATVFEVSNDVMINGQKLPKGKYSLHTIPNKDEWTIIFNKTWNQWGSFNYKAEEDALRVNVKPVAGEFKETMAIDVENVMDTTADVVIAWEKVRVPFKLDIGDLSGRILKNARQQMVRNPIVAAGFVLDSKLKSILRRSNRLA